MSDDHKKSARVINGACCSCREFLGRPKNVALTIIEGHSCEVIYQRSDRDLEASSAAGCVICKSLSNTDARRDAYQMLRTIAPSCDSRSRLDERKYTFRVNQSSDGKVRYFIVHYAWGEGSEHGEYEVRFNIMMADNAEKYPYRPANPDLGSDVALSWASEQLQNCITSHKTCRSLVNSNLSVNLFPTRLLYVNRRLKPHTVRLYQSKPGETGPYVVLSYCWGETKNHTTTIDNFEQHLHEIPASSLPRTIADAIYVSGKLGFDYIWVDSFCILQDSAEDVAKEIAQMDSIYKNATLTLMAGSARWCDEGFLQVRTNKTDRDREMRCIIPLYDKLNKLAGNMHLEVGWHHWYPPHIGISNEPLNQRGWTMQENMLSMRKLYFGSERLFWVCQMKLLPDGGIISGADREIWHRFPKEVGKSVRYRVYADLRLLQKVVPEFWTSAVQQYTKRRLTFGEDKLPAIAAIAAHMQSLTGWRYVAGLWQERMILGLLWKRSGFITNSFPRPVKWRAPSWSWASLDDPVSYDDLDYICGTVATVVSCIAEPLLPANPLGQLRKAELVIRGPLWAVSFTKIGRLAAIADYLEDDETAQATWTSDRAELLLRLSLPDPQNNRSPTESKILSRVFESGWKPRANGTESKGPNAWCLALGEREIFAKDGSLEYYAITGLVLTKTTNDCFQRVGLFLWPEINSRDSKASPFMSAPDTTVKII